MTSTIFNDKPFVVRSPDVTYTDDEMVSKYTYQVNQSFTFSVLLPALNFWRAGRFVDQNT